jgi:rare lipoprotein A
MKYILTLLLLLSLTEPKSPTEYEYTKVSWYGNGFHGELTASGKIFNQNKLTAAHKKLPFGTRVEITNLRNNKTVTVKIIDRGPFIKSRDFDLSRAAFDSIADLDKGVIKVKYQIL